MSTTGALAGAVPQLGVSARGKRTVLFGGALVALALVGATLLAHARLQGPGPYVAPFLPICATVWCVAELLTAFLLISQFYVGGKMSFAIVAFGYGVTGLMTIPYLGFFPNVFGSGPYASGDLQISAWLWTAWHLIFPVTIAVAVALEDAVDRVRVPRRAIPAALCATVGAAATFAVLVSELAYALRNRLPIAILPNGVFSHLWSAGVQPFVVAVGAISLGVACARAHRMSPLQVWLAIAVLTMTLDGLVNCWAPARYSMVWYVGKGEALLTSVAVLSMLLIEVATLYRNLFDAASIDTLTGLANRRGFADLLATALRPRTRDGGVALLVVDVDHFKAYNDRFGHAAGDVALAEIAKSLAGSLSYPADSVARFGGEEFVMLLVDRSAGEAERSAQRVCDRIARLPLGCDGDHAALTISIGLAHSSRREGASPDALFESADRALYAAKAQGRNRVVTAELTRRAAAPHLHAVG